MQSEARTAACNSGRNVDVPTVHSFTVN